MSKEKPHIAMIGTGAMGGALGTLLADAGEQVTMIDTDHDIVRCVSQSGFRLEGAAGERQVSVRVSAEPRAANWADVAIVLTTANDTAAASSTAAHVLKDDGFALTLQNGIGNVEQLVAVLGNERVAAGSIRSSAQKIAPGESDLTKLDPTVIGEHAVLAAAVIATGMPVQAQDLGEVILEEIIVTATKRAGGIEAQQAAVAISAYSGDQLDAMHFRDLQAIGFSAPSGDITIWVVPS